MRTNGDARTSFRLPLILPQLDPRLGWGLVLALGLAVRCRQYFFNASYWYDEAYLILTIRDHSLANLLGALPYQLTAPPLFLWLTRALHEWGGDGELLMRLPAFLGGLAALLLMIPLARRRARSAARVLAVCLPRFRAARRHARCGCSLVRIMTFSSPK